MEFSTLKKPGGRVAVSVAVDDKDEFYFEKFFTLKNMPGSGDYARVVYRIDPGLRGTRHKIRLRLFHDETGNAVEIAPPMKIFYEPISENESTRNIARAPDTRG